VAGSAGRCSWRRERPATPRSWGSSEWLAAGARHTGVDIRLNSSIEGHEVLALSPDVVIVATGGLPDTEFLESGADLVPSTWDVLSGTPRPGRRVLVYDDHGGEQALTAAERLATAGSVVEIVTPDRMVGQSVSGTIYPDYLAILYGAGAKLTADHTLISVRRESGGLVATLSNAYSDEAVERRVDQVVVEHGTLPVDDIYFELVEGSANRGELDLDAFAAGRRQELPGQGGYQLFRIGDALAHRNIHAAIYDARRLCMAL
jgi:N-methyl-L-proline demethylase